MKRKKFGIAHPAFGYIFGLVLAALYITFENFISPTASSLFGRSWAFLQEIFFFIFLGVALKILFLRLLPKAVNVQPMTPAAFAGLTTEDAIKASQRVVAPLPEISGESKKIPQGDLALDFRSINERSESLMSLGFLLEVEGAMISKPRAGIPTFVRLFSNPQDSWVMVSQSFPMGRAPLPVVIAVTTFLEDDWEISDSTQKSNWLLWMLRRAKAIGKGHIETASTSDVCTAHQKRCELVATKLNIHVLRLTAEDYWQKSNDHLLYVRKLLIRRSMFLAFLQTLYHRFAKTTEWWGDFEKAAQHK